MIINDTLIAFIRKITFFKVLQFFDNAGILYFETCVTFKAVFIWTLTGVKNHAYYAS